MKGRNSLSRALDRELRSMVVAYQEVGIGGFENLGIWDG